MTMRKTIGLSLALLVASGAAMAKQERPRHPHPGAKSRAEAARHPGSKAARSRRETERLALRTTAPHRAALSQARVAEYAARDVRVIDRAARSRAAEARDTADRSVIEPNVAAEPVLRTAVARSSGPRFVLFRPAVQNAARQGERRATAVTATLPPPDEYISRVRVVGRPEIGKAAWYGGDFLGQRTASGEPLDSVHITAAHRTLPLFSRVRVTNLRNGRSVIATINDRGPVSRRLLIDLSPRAARELHMIGAGVAPVEIEPVIVTNVAASRDAAPRIVAEATQPR